MPPLVYADVHLASKYIGETIYNTKGVCYFSSLFNDPPTRYTRTNSLMAVKKKTTSSKAATRKAPAVASKQTKSQVVQSISESTGLTKKDVSAVLGALGDLVMGHMRKRGSGEFQIPETGVKIRRVKKPARKARLGRNPATGEEIKIAAKPASTTVRVTALKSLKEAVKS